MPRCAAFKPDGMPCERIVGASQSYCYSHDPARTEERRRAASRAGRGGTTAEIRALKRQLETLADDVLEGKIDRGVASVANQIHNTRLRAIEVERKVREQEEILQRIEALEAQRASARGGRVWGT
jgi:hypothetical protein